MNPKGKQLMEDTVCGIILGIGAGILCIFAVQALDKEAAARAIWETEEAGEVENISPLEYYRSQQ